MAARNIAGIASLGMAYMAVGHEDSPVNYKKVRTFVSDKVVDISTQYPLPQLMYIATWAKKFLKVVRVRLWLGTEAKVGAEKL